MDNLRLYRALSRFRFMNYRAKIMIVAFLGTHVPLVALVANVASKTASDWQSFIGILLVALVATLAGTGVTLLILNQLLRPVLLTSRALRAYRTDRRIEPLPTDFSDEVGTLMADAEGTIRHLEETRTRLENFDAATGLANRASFTRSVAERIVTGEPFAICAVTLNSFERLAASVDADTAEAAATQVARRLDGFLGHGASLSRIASDRFAFLAGDAQDAAADWAGADEQLRDVMLQCGAQIRLDRMNVQPSLSGGISVFPRDGATAAELIDCAAAATSMSDNMSQVAFYSPKARAEALDRFLIEEELRVALREGHLALHYQPVVDLAQGRAVGAEALMRWNHPERGMIPPGRFIPVAESSGLIVPMGLWVLDAACAQIAQWNATGLPGLKVAVNLSARQFHDSRLIEQVRDALGKHAVAPDQLEIELTESAAMDDFGHSRTIFGKLRDLGVGIAIDDFGTGFASLSYLRRLPFDKLKVDREFVSNVHLLPENQAICTALITLANGLGLRVLAEGTEEEEEVGFLFERGCALFQGYYLGRPAPAQDFVSAITSPRIAEVATRLDPRGRVRSA